MWVKVSKDKYQLIEAVADSAGKLAKICGVPRKTIESANHRYVIGQAPLPTYIHIEDDEVL